MIAVTCFFQQYLPTLSHVANFAPSVRCQHNLIFIVAASVIILVCITSASIQHLLSTTTTILVSRFLWTGNRRQKGPVCVTQQDRCGTSKIIEQHGYNCATAKINHKLPVLSTKKYNLNT